MEILSQAFVALFCMVAAVACLHSLLSRLLAKQNISPLGLLISIAQLSAILLLSAGCTTLLGLTIAWLVTLTHLPSLYFRWKSGFDCNCYVSDGEFTSKYLVVAASIGIPASLSVATWHLPTIAPGFSGYAVALFLISCIAISFWRNMTAGLLREQYERISSLQTSRFRAGTAEVEGNAWRGIPAPQVLFLGSVVCLPCTQAGLDLIALVQAMPGRFPVKMALHKYPEDAPSRFKGVEILSVSAMDALVPFRVVPSLAIVRESGDYLIFEGLDDIRIGFGHMMRELK